MNAPVLKSVKSKWLCQNLKEKKIQVQDRVKILYFDRRRAQT